MNIVIKLYQTLNSLRSLPFSLSDALLICFLHDVEKPWKYELINRELHVIEALKEKPAQHEFRMNKLASYGIVLTVSQLNGLKYVEGEISDYSSRERKMNELAALCHMADVASARIWYNYPVFKNGINW